MKIIPAMDIMDGKCVRLIRGNFNQKKMYPGDPLAQAKQFEDAGFEYLHLVDLDGARLKKMVNIRILERIARHTDLKIDFSGGIQSEMSLKTAFAYGAYQVSAGSIPVKNTPLFSTWIREYGNEKIILGADVQNGLIAISGWMEQTAIPISNFIEGFLKLGIKYVICTDIGRDGLLGGCALELYKSLKMLFPDIHMIASGGISSIEELKQLKHLGMYGAIVGKALYEGKIKLSALQQLNDQ